MDIRRFAACLIAYSLIALFASGAMATKKNSIRSELTVLTSKAIIQNTRRGDIEGVAELREEVEFLDMWIERAVIGGGLGMLLALALIVSATPSTIGSRTDDQNNGGERK